MNALKTELMELVERLPDDQVPGVLSYLRLSTEATRGQRLTDNEAFSWFDKATKGPSNASDPETIDAVLARGFGR